MVHRNDILAHVTTGVVYLFDSATPGGWAGVPDSMRFDWLVLFDSIREAGGGEVVDAITKTGLCPVVLCGCRWVVQHSTLQPGKNVYWFLREAATWGRDCLPGSIRKPPTYYLTPRRDLVGIHSSVGVCRHLCGAGKKRLPQIHLFHHVADAWRFLLDVGLPVTH